MISANLKEEFLEGLFLYIKSTLKTRDNKKITKREKGL